MVEQFIKEGIYKHYKLKLLKFFKCFNYCYFRPANEWFNRLEHEYINIDNLFKLNASQMIIVYSRSDKLEVDRRLVQGPCIFMPQPNEW